MSAFHLLPSTASAWSHVRALLPQRSDFTAMRRNPKRDLLAGITVALVALPLALAFGVASGLGAGAGLITAIVAGAVAAFFGGSNLQISGPTGAMTVVLLPIVAQFGVSAVLVVGLLAGVILIALALAGAGRYMKFIPLPVVEGFTLGIAIIIGLQQVPAALGQSVDGERIVINAITAVGQFITQPNWAALAVTAFVAGSILLALRLRPGLPVALPAVIVITAATAVLHLNVASIGALPHGLPAPSMPNIPWANLSALVLPAIAVAALAALESLLSATVADAMRVGERHDPNRELFGQGMANLASPIFGGVPATAAIARTAVNVRTGAQSRLAALTQSAVLLIVVLIAAQWVAHIPLAALAGVLIATVIQMVEVSSLRALLHTTKGDALVLIATAAATVIFDLVVAVIVGLAIAALAALRQMAKSARIDELALDPADHSEEEQELLAQNVIAYRLEGPLFFGAAHSFLLQVAETSHVQVVILRMSRVSTIDATGASVLIDTINTLEHRGITVLLSGVRPEQVSILRALGVYQRLNERGQIFDSTPEAIAFARDVIQQASS